MSLPEVPLVSFPPDSGPQLHAQPPTAPEKKRAAEELRLTFLRFLLTGLVNLVLLISASHPYFQLTFFFFLFLYFIQFFLVLFGWECWFPATASAWPEMEFEISCLKTIIFQIRMYYIL